VVPEVVVDLDTTGGVTTKDDVVGVTTEGLDVLVDPVKSLLNIQNAEVLGVVRVGFLQFGRVGRSIDAFSGIEVDVDNAVLGKVCALNLRVAGGSSDHGTAVHVHEDG